MRSGATVLRVEEMSTDHMTGIRFTKIPVDMLVNAPEISDGRICSEACSADLLCTCWKLKKRLTRIPRWTVASDRRLTTDCYTIPCSYTLPW